MYYPTVSENRVTAIPTKCVAFCLFCDYLGIPVTHFCVNMGSVLLIPRHSRIETTFVFIFLIFVL